MIFTSKRHKQAKYEGHTAALNGLGMNDNPYTSLGKVGQTHASLWDAGYQDGARELVELKESEIK